MSENVVVAFEPRRREAPPLRCAELRLDEDCGISLILCDDAGNVVATLAYALLASWPGDFDSTFTPLLAEVARNVDDRVMSHDVHADLQRSAARDRQHH